MIEKKEYRPSAKAPVFVIIEDRDHTARAVAAIKNRWRGESRVQEGEAWL